MVPKRRLPAKGGDLGLAGKKKRKSARGESEVRGHLRFQEKGKS